MDWIVARGERTEQERAQGALQPDLERSGHAFRKNADAPSGRFAHRFRSHEQLFRSLPFSPTAAYIALMATVIFDTLELVTRLKNAGFADEQAESVVRVISDAQQELVSRDYLDNALQRELAPLRTELAVLKWMTGIVIGGVVALIIKTFLA